MRRILSPRFVNITAISLLRSDVPIKTKRCSPIEWRGSSTIPPNESPNVLEASSKLTPCFALFLAAFPGSHSKIIIQKLPDLLASA